MPLMAHNSTEEKKSRASKLHCAMFTLPSKQASANHVAAATKSVKKTSHFTKYKMLFIQKGFYLIIISFKIAEKWRFLKQPECIISYDKSVHKHRSGRQINEWT